MKRIQSQEWLQTFFPMAFMYFTLSLFRTIQFTSLFSIGIKPMPLDLALPPLHTSNKQEEEEEEEERPKS